MKNRSKILIQSIALGGLSLLFLLGGSVKSGAACIGILEPVPSLKKLNPSELPDYKLDDADQGDWEAGSRAELKKALIRQIDLCGSFQETWDFAGKKVTRERWCRDTTRWFLTRLETVNSLTELFQAAKRELEWYQSTGKPDTHQMQFTGYYNPVYHAKLHRDAVYRYPLYRLPENPMLQTLSREEITRGGLSGKGLELAWLSNPVDPFMLQVQGSGAILLDSGEGVEIRQIINYAGQNGKPYVSLGKLMRAAGISEEYISLQGIKKYFLEVHPEDWEKFSNQNPSFVFFKKDENGPYGYSGAVLTPKHSIAVDKTVFPMGAIGLLETERPSRLTGQEPQEWKKFTQFVVAQDTGGAIRSPGRVDTFWGEGNYAEATAGHLDRGGSLYFVLVPESRTR